MSLFTENFDTTTVGSLPTGWTGTTGWSVQAGSPNISSPNVMDVGASAGTNAYYNAQTWTASSVLVATRITSVPSAQYGVLTSGRNVGGLAGYIGVLTWSQDGTASCAIRRIGVSPAFLQSAEAIYADNTLPAQGDWIWMRLAYDPSISSLRFRFWKNGTPEPTSWQLTAIENTLTGAGWAGLYSEQSSTVAFDSFEVDTYSGGGNVPQPSVSSFSPLSGPVGTQVTITGTGFSTNPGGNLMTIGGAACAIVSSTSTSIVLNIPSGAQTDPFVVATAGGSTQSASSFTVTPPAVSGNTPTITSFAPASGPVGTLVTIAGTNFIPYSGPPNVQGNQVFFNGVAAAVMSAGTTTILATVPPTATTGPIQVVTSAGSVISTSVFTVTGTTTVGGGAGPGDPYTGTEDEGPLTPTDLLPFLRAMLKDTTADLPEIGLVLPTWDDHELYRYLELARGEYSRHRGKRATLLMTTVANQQAYSVANARVIEDVMWAPAGYDLDQISALAAALAGGPGLLWGGGVPVVGRVYFDSPASIQVWSIIRESWRRTFGGHWQHADGPGSFNLIPVPTEAGTNIIVKYRVEMHWADIPWEHRSFILAQAVLYAISGLTYQIVAGSNAAGVKLSLGLRSLTMLIQQQYADALNIREPGVTAGRS